MKKIIVNKAKCRLCGDIITSNYRHDFVECGCGEISVDGGLDYLKRGAMHIENFIEMSECEEEHSDLPTELW